MANANDPFDEVNVPGPLIGPGDDIYPITKSDSLDLPTAVRAIRAAGAGNIQVTTRNGNTRILAFAAGETRFVRATRVWSTNTTATGIEGIV